MMVLQCSTGVLVLVALLCGTATAAGKKQVKTPKPRTSSPAVLMAAEAVTPGRYQLHHVEYSVTDQSSDATMAKKELILLDTATGQMKICSQKIWTNTAVGKDISERKCLPFDTYAEYPAGSQKLKYSRESAPQRP